MDGDTESIAAQGHKEVALKAMDKLDKLTSSATIPTYNAQGEPTSITLKFVDSAVYRAMAELSDMSGYDSQSVKITKQVTGTLNKALHPAMTFGIVDIVTTRGTGSDNSTTYNDSFNNPTQSPQTVDNVAANVTPNATDSHASTESNETINNEATPEVKAER
jgi:hypothetical protein